MMTQSSADAWASGENLIVPRYGIRIAMAVASLAAAGFCLFTLLGERQWDKEEPPVLPTRADPLWMVVLWVALPLIPFILSGVLLSRRGEQSKAAGAGFAAVLFGNGLFIAVLAFFGQFLKLFPDPYTQQEQAAILIFFASCIWILISAFRIAAKASWRVFFLAAAATLVWMTWGQHSLWSTERRLDLQYEQHKAQVAAKRFEPVVEAEHQLASLGGCLILNKSMHPQDGYPSSLDPPPANWPCEGKLRRTQRGIYPQLCPSGDRLTTSVAKAPTVRAGAIIRNAVMQSAGSLWAFGASGALAIWIVRALMPFEASRGKIQQLRVWFRGAAPQSESDTSMLVPDDSAGSLFLLSS